jgi:glycosyltransferase involved in cell wall biosynthesis
MSEAPQIAVVVPTRDRAGSLRRLLEHLDRQTFGPFEIVVVDDCSGDATAEVAAAWPGVTLCRTAAPSGAAAARNVGWRRATAPLVAFTDDDCRPEPGWLAALVDGFAGADVVQGVTRHDPADAVGRGPFSQIVEVDGYSGQFETSNVAYRRSLLEELGGFDERFDGDSFGEDVDLGWRALERSARTAFVDGAVVVHDTKRGPVLDEVRASIRGARRWRHIGRVVRDHPGYRAHRLYRDPFLMATHPPTWVALAGVAVVAARPRSAGAWCVAAAAFAPWVRHRLRVEPRPGRFRDQLVALPVSFVVDATQAVTVAASGARHRVLLL